MLSPKLIEIKSIEENKLEIKFETGEVKIFDVSPYMKGKWFEELFDKEYFKTVHIINNGYGIEWENGQDIAPHEIYDLSIPMNKTFMKK